MGLDWTSAAVLVLVTVAVVNRIRESFKDIPSWGYTLIAFGVGAVLYFIGVYAPDMVKIPLTIGLAASGIYDAYKKT